MGNLGSPSWFPMSLVPHVLGSPCQHEKRRLVPQSCVIIGMCDARPAGDGGEHVPEPYSGGVGVGRVVDGFCEKGHVARDCREASVGKNEVSTNGSELERLDLVQ